MEFSDLVAPVQDLGVDFDAAIAPWTWLIDGQPSPLLITAMGDVFMKRGEEVYFLDTFTGSFSRVSSSLTEWKARLQNGDDVFEWFRPDYLTEVRKSGRQLSIGEVYSPIVPAVLGGKVTAENYTPSPWRMHLHVLGHIHRQAKDLPPGTGVTFHVEPFDG